VANKSGLRQRERDEDADRVQRDEPVDAALVEREEQRRNDGQHDDPEGEGEPVAALRELPGHEPVDGQDRREARETGEARIRGENEDDRGRCLDEVEEHAFADDRLRQETKDALRLRRVHLDPEVGRENARSTRNAPSASLAGTAAGGATGAGMSPDSTRKNPIPRTTTTAAT